MMDRLRHPLRRDKKETIWALRDVTFALGAGEVVGIIGRNGAGKTTLLKVLSRITEPTSGRVELYGRVGSLLEVGTGFHPDFTGRENVYLSGSILGMTRAEIRNRFDAIVAFAEVEQFLDTPVKRYSSGMYVRLAFAVAAHLDPEILLVDEVLAVGDVTFQQKCLGKMNEVASGGRTVVIVSHNLPMIRQLCSKAAMIEAGRLVYLGDTNECLRRYMGARDASGGAILSRFTVKTPLLKLWETTVNDSAADSVTLSENENLLRVTIAGEASSPLPLALEARILDGHGMPVAYFNPGYESGRFFTAHGPFRLRSEIRLPRIPQGRFVLDLQLTYPGIDIWAVAPEAAIIDAQGNTTATGQTMKYEKFAFTLLEGQSWMDAPELAPESED